MYITHNFVIFGPIPNIIMKGCSGDKYLPDYLYFGWVGYIIKLSSMRQPLTGTYVARSTKSVETPKLHQKIPLWVGLFGKPLSLNPPPPPKID